MSFSAESGRRQILEDGSAAAGELAHALEMLTDLYEHLDDDTAERMEGALFRPVQHALGLLRRTMSEFAARFGLPAPAPPPERGPGRPRDARAVIDAAAAAVVVADATLAELQDSLLPVEVGDPPLRAGLSATRELLGPVPRACTELVRTLGR